MYTESLATLATLLIAVASAASSNYNVVHEKRDMSPADWVQKDRVAPSLMIPVKIGLAQSNLDRGHDELMKVSDPASPDFGKHWTLNEISDFFAPSQDSVDSITQWLNSAGIHPSRIAQSESRGWMNFHANAGELEALLDTHYHYYEHSPSGAVQVACEEYSVPGEMQKHVDLILPTLQFGNQLQYKGQGRRSSGPTRTAKSGASRGSAVKSRRSVVPNDSCDGQITPSCLRTLYNLPKGTLNLSSYGIMEIDDSFLQQDLDIFFSTPALNDAGVPNGTAPSFEGIDGGYRDPNDHDESDLDLQYAMTLVYPQQVTLYQVGDNGTNSGNASYNNFLDALDASYCTYDGGDNPNYDETFPDPGGFQGPENCGTRKAAAVISASYVSIESDFSVPYVKRQCYEYMKLGMAGTSFLWASGDYGVAGFGEQCTGRYNHTFSPEFPGSCPYVTSVGATQVPAGGSINSPEVACNSDIITGGGFSDVFTLPSYQKAAMEYYYAKYPPPYTSAQYNNSQNARGYPDVSANGATYVIVLDGDYEEEYGTSASTPTFGGVITLINNERASKGKGPLGFLNPALYANPDMFNDIVNGTNPGCNTTGFSAVPGWDPVTGLGTPNYTKMVAQLASLP